MILAAPFVIPFAEIIGVSIAALGMAKATDKVQEFIEENPEESIKIFQMIMPAQSLANILKNESSEDNEDIEYDDFGEEIKVESEPRSTKEIVLEEVARGRGKKGLPARGNFSSKGAVDGAVSITGNVKRGLRDAGRIRQGNDPNYDASKKYQGYKRFIRPKKADGGMAGTKTYHQYHDQYVPMDSEGMGYANGGGVGSMIKPKRGLVNESGGYAGNWYDGLEGQDLAVYNSMKAGQHSDQVIKDTIEARNTGDNVVETNTISEAIVPNISRNYNTSSGISSPGTKAPGTMAASYANSIDDQSIQGKINNAMYDFKENTQTKLTDPNTFIGKMGLNAGSMIGSGIGALAGIPGLGFIMNALGKNSNFNSGARRELNTPMQLGIYNQDKTGTGYFSQGPVQPGISSLSDTYKSGLNNRQFGGVTVDDIGRIVNTGKYNTPENVMAGYNTGFDLGATAFDRYDKIDDTLEDMDPTDPRYQSLKERQTALTDFALANAAAQKKAYQAKIDRAIARDNAAAEERARVKSITAGYGGHDNSPGATGPTAAGAGMGVGGGYASDYGFIKDGGITQDAPKGISTMFVRKR